MAEPTHPKPELVAPAGSPEALLAALEAGADAVYLGLPDWSARARAKNFTLADLRRLVPVAHGQKRKVYVALNTLLKEPEVPRALDAAWELGCLGVDGVILQDLGLWAACRGAFPELPLHASTQLSVHNSAGVRQLEAMGFARGVLARECTIPEIAALRRVSTLPLEAFVHGALCYGVSGQCLASSALTGRSANRGWCAQVCRWGFRSADGPERHPLSPSDLSLVARVADLAAAGVSALKIEGRLKGADYVHAVVRAYRKVLDAPAHDRAGALGAAQEILGAALTRPVTEGYAYHPRPVEVLKAGGRPAVGAEVGRVHRWKEGSLTLALSEDLARGDRIRIQTGKKGEGVALVLRRFRRERVPGGVRLSLECPEPVDRGDRVYRVKGARGEELEQRLAQEVRRLPAEPGVPLGLRVSLAEGGALVLEARTGLAAARIEVPVPTHPAECHPLDKGILEKHLGRLGGAGYHLAALAVAGALPPVVIPPSAFKEVRERLVAAVDQARATEAARRRALAGALRRPTTPAPTADKRLWIRVETPRSLWAVLGRPFHRLVVAMSRDCLRIRERLAAELKGGLERVVWELPPFLPEGDLHLYRERLEALYGEGYREVAATNLGHLELVRGLGFTVHGGAALHTLNGWAAAALGQLGCRTVTLSPEADGEALAAAAAAGWPLPPVALAYGNLPLFLTRLDPAVTWPEGVPAETVDGVALRWSPAPRPLGQDWARVYGPEPLGWTHRLPDLKALGVADFLFDLQGRVYGDKEIGVVLDKFKAERPLSGTTEGNWQRGLR